MQSADIEKIIRRKIESDEKIGEHSGSSGHLSFVSYTLDNYRIGHKKESIEIKYKYSVITETEFTYYPDNPPHEISFTKTLLIDGSGNIIEESARRLAEGEK